jgi:hypothetical protein
MGLAAALLWGLGPLATPSQVELRWESVAGCPDSAVIAEDLDTVLGAGARAHVAEVTGRLAGERGAYVLHLEVALAGHRERRELRANDCALLSRAGVLVVAVTIDALATSASVQAIRSTPPGDTAQLPAAAGRVPEPDPRTPGSHVAVEPRASARVRPRGEPPEPRAAPRASLAKPDEPARSRARGGTLAAHAGVATGMTPGITGGLEVELAWRLGPVRLAAAGFHWFARATELQPGAGIQAALSGGSLRGCVVFTRARLEVPLCAGLDLAAMHGGGIGPSLTPPRDVSDLFVGVAAGAGLTVWVAKRFALQARAEGVLGARRPAMSLQIADEAREAFRIPPVSVRLVAGPLFRLW